MLGIFINWNTCLNNDNNIFRQYENSINNIWNSINETQLHSNSTRLMMCQWLCSNCNWISGHWEHFALDICIRAKIMLCCVIDILPKNLPTQHNHHQWLEIHTEIGQFKLSTILNVILTSSFIKMSQKFCTFTLRNLVNRPRSADEQIYTTLFILLPLSQTNKSLFQISIDIIFKHQSYSKSNIVSRVIQHWIEQ